MFIYIPPDTAVNQPLNVQPLRTGIGSSPIAVFCATVLVIPDVSVPPLGLNVIEYFGGSGGVG